MILDIPVDVPVSLSLTPIRISQILIPQINIGPGLVFQASIAGITTPPAASSGIFSSQNPCSLIGACVALELAPVVNVGPIALGPIELGFVNDQVLSLAIGGPGKGITFDGAAVLGPIDVNLAKHLIEQFPYVYGVDAEIDLPIIGSSGELDLGQIDLTGRLFAYFNQRLGLCIARICTTTPGMSIQAMVNYLNGGTPVGSSLGVFPPGLSTTQSTLIDTALDNSFPPSVLLPAMPINAGINESTAVSGSGTLGPIPLPYRR